MKYNKPNSLFIATVLCLLMSCGSDEGSRLSFSDSAAVDNNTVTRFASVSEDEFCQDRSPQECFTLILSIPSPNLEKSLGLSTLALASRSESFRVPLLRSCHRGLAAYIDGFGGVAFSRRNRLFRGIEESRCVIDYVKRELYETPDLPQGQFGLAARLSGWSVNGSVSNSSLNAIDVTIKGATLDVSYRNAKVFGQPVGEDRSRWSDLIEADFLRPFARRTPMTTKSFTQSFSDEIQLRFSAAEGFSTIGNTLKSLESSGSRDLISGFLAEAAQLGTSLTESGRLAASVSLLGIGLDALRSLCKEDCGKLQTETLEAVTLLNQALADESVVDSRSKAIYSDSHLVLPGKLIDDAFWNSSGGFLDDALGWERTPADYDPLTDDIY